MTTTNAPHLGALTHCLLRLGFRQEVAETIGRLLCEGLWNYQQDDLLAMLASCEKAQGEEMGTAGFDELVANIHLRTVRAHATVFYHSLRRLGFKERDAAKFARYFGRNLKNANCDTLKVLLLEAPAPPAEVK